MTNFARDIKDLSIAMEALARIQGSDEYYSRIARLLENRIQQMEDQVRSETYILEPGPAPKSQDDEIPF